jgi:hypothetical protein
MLDTDNIRILTLTDGFNDYLRYGERYGIIPDTTFTATELLDNKSWRGRVVIKTIYALNGRLQVSIGDTVKYTRLSREAMIVEITPELKPVVFVKDFGLLPVEWAELSLYEPYKL